jgi:hypothetical protein
MHGRPEKVLNSVIACLFFVEFIGRTIFFYTFAMDYHGKCMKKTAAALPVRIVRFYVEGFKSMEWGRTLWVLILIKLFIMFAILRLFFFPRYLDKFETSSGKEEYVSGELIHRVFTP